MRERRKTIIFFLLIALIFIGQFYFVKSNTGSFDLIEWMLASVFLLFIFPAFVIARVYKEKISDYYLKLNFFKDKQVKTIIFLETIVFIGLLYFFVIKLGWIKNFMAYEWFFGSWGVILLVEITIVPLLIFVEEFFFRGVVFKNFLEKYNLFWALIIQVVLIIIYQLILSSFLPWQLIAILFITNLFLGWVVAQTRSIWISFFIMILVRYLIDGYILYQVKFLLGS